MPKLWNDTIQAHRSDVREKILDTASRLVDAGGLRGVNMQRLAEETGIGRATLYKYFANVEAVLRAWHGRHVDAHLAEIAAVRHGQGDIVERLRAILATFADMAYRSGQQDAALAALIHRDDSVVRAQGHLRGIVRDLIAQGAKSKRLRRDVPPDELAHFCLHAIAAAAQLSSKVARRRLVDVTLAALGAR